MERPRDDRHHDHDRRDCRLRRPVLPELDERRALLHRLTLLDQDRGDACRRRSTRPASPSSSIRGSRRSALRRHASPTFTSIFQTVPVMCAFTLVAMGRAAYHGRPARHRGRHVEGELLVGVAVLGPADAADARGARQVARRARQPARVAVGDREPARCTAPAGQAATQGAGQPAHPSPSGAPAALDRRAGRHDDQRAVGPPGAEDGMNLQAERPGRAQAGRAPEALKRQRRDAVGEREEEPIGRAGASGRPSAARRRRATSRACSDRADAAPVGRLGRRAKARNIAARRADDEAPARRRSAASGSKRARRSVGATGAQAASKAAADSGSRMLNPRAASARQRAARRGGDFQGGAPARRPRPTSAGTDTASSARPTAGSSAILTAFSTHAPVGVPANLPVTVADVTWPLLPMTTLTIAMPGTLNWL